MLRQRCGARRHAFQGEIVRRCGERRGDIEQRAADERAAVDQVRHDDPDIETLIDEIDRPVAGHAQFDARIAFLKRAQQRCELEQRERCQCDELQRAGRIDRSVRNRCFDCFDLFQHRATTIGIGPSGFGQRYASRRAIQQACVEVRFEKRNITGDDCIRDFERGRCTAERLCLGDLQEDAHRLELIHRADGFAYARWRAAGSVSGGTKRQEECCIACAIVYDVCSFRSSRSVRITNECRSPETVVHLQLIKLRAISRWEARVSKSKRT